MVAAAPPKSTAPCHRHQRPHLYRDLRAGRDVRTYASSIRIANAMNNESIEQGVAGYPPQGVGSPER